MPFSFVDPLASKRDIPAANFMMHEPHCRRHVELCKFCAEPVPKSQMEEHVEENHVEVSCEKCQRKVPKDLMDDHLVSLSTQHPDEVMNECVIVAVTESEQLKRFVATYFVSFAFYYLCF